MINDTETCSGRRTDIAPDDDVPVRVVASGAATHPTDESLGLERGISERSKPRVYRRTSTV
jgi:hypothetical protein